MSDNPLLTSRRRATVPLYPGDMEERLAEFDRRLEEAYAVESDSGNSRASSVSDTDRIAAEKDAYVEQVASDAPKVVLEGISERTVQRLRDDHPPRKGNDLDERAGYNREEFASALVRACLVEPEVTDEQWEEFVEEASAGRMQTLFEHATEVTGEEVDLPKSSAVTALTRLRERERRLRGELD